METVLIRLTNNDRIAGKLIYHNNYMVSLYAPMSIKKEQHIMLDEDSDDPSSKGYYVYTPYDPLSDSAMVVFDIQHVLTVTIPKDIIEKFYNEAWVKYYPKYENFRKSMIDRYDLEDDFLDDNEFNPDKLKDMFKEFLSKPKSDNK